jgi:hypothetical protein
MEEVVMFVIRDREVDCCGNCPHNKEWPNAFLSIIPFQSYIPEWFKKILAPTHRCEVSLDTVLFDTAGRLIMNPNRIPVWCPFES